VQPTFNELDKFALLFHPKVHKQARRAYRKAQPEDFLNFPAKTKWTGIPKK